MVIGIDIRNIGKKRTGDEVVFFNLVKSLAGSDGKNNYKLFTDITDTPILQYMEVSLGIDGKKNFKIISLPTKNKFTWNFWTLPKYLRQSSVDVYLTQYITPWFVPRKTKIVTIIHDVSFKVYKQFIKKSDLFFLSCLIPISLKRADKIIAVSQFTRDEIIKYYKVDPKKVEWIYNAVADNFLAQDVSEEKIQAVRKKYHLPKKYILYLGTLQPRKNLPTLIEAFALLKSNPSSNISNIKLVLAGGKGHNFDQKIAVAIKKHRLESDVIFPGFIDEEDKAAIMAEAEIFCFPSLYEGFGIPILEAMSVGLPVVASNIPPHQEIANDAVLFFDPGNPRELADKLSKLTDNENLRRDLIEKGKDQVKKFSWQKTGEKTVRIFKQLRRVE